METEYNRDNFNIYGLRGQIQYYYQALEMILSTDAPDEEDLTDSAFLEIDRGATDLNGYIHACCVVSLRGFQYIRKDFIVLAA